MIGKEKKEKIGRRKNEERRLKRKSKKKILFSLSHVFGLTFGSKTAGNG